MLALWRLSPRHTWSQASMVAPTTCAVAVVHVAEDGVVVAAEAAALVVVAGGVPARTTASTSSGSWTVSSCSSVASGRIDHLHPVVEDPERLREPHRQVDPHRGHRVGRGRSRSSVRLGSKTTVAGPAALLHAGHATCYPRCRADARPLNRVVARLTADPCSSTPSSTTAAPGRPYAACAPVGATRPKEPNMTTLSLLTPSGRLTLGNLLGALRPMADAAGTDAFYGISDLHAMTTPARPGRAAGRAPGSWRRCCWRPGSSAARCSGRARCPRTPTWPTCWSAPPTPAS